MLPTSNKLINKIEMYELFVRMRRISEMEDSPEKERKLNRVVNEIGHIMLSLITRYSNSRKFWGYSYKCDFISDALLIASKAIRKQTFNVDKSTEPFSYFTSVAHWAFVQTIKKEKNKTIKEFDYIKDQLTEAQAKLDYREHIHECDLIQNLIDGCVDDDIINTELNKMEEENNE